MGKTFTRMKSQKLVLRKRVKKTLIATCPYCWVGGANVTTRKSKQQERPRNHICPKCGKSFRVDAKDGSARVTIK